MKHKDKVEHLMEFISKDTKIPVDKLHLIGVNRKDLSDSITQFISSGASYDSAITAVKALWLKSSLEQTSKPVTDEEMKLMGFELKDDVWTHKQTLQRYTKIELLRTSFKQIELAVLQSPLYEKP